jgi:hypothetical protein
MLSNRRFLAIISIPLLPQLIQAVSNRQFLEKLARLETPPNPNKTNAEHEF